MKAVIDISGQPIGNVLIKTSLQHRKGVVRTQTINNGFRIKFDSVGNARKALKALYNELKEIDPETSYLEFNKNTFRYDASYCVLSKIYE